MGYSLEDFYDEKSGEGSFREKYEECVNDPRLARETVPAIDLDETDYAQSVGNRRTIHVLP